MRETTCGFIIVGDTCDCCNQPWAECECSKNATITVGSSYSTDERKEAYQELSQGHTDEQLDLAAVLRGIARDIESEQYTDWIKAGVDLEVVLKAIAARAKVFEYYRYRWIPLSSTI